MELAKNTPKQEQVIGIKTEYGGFESVTGKTRKRFGARSTVNDAANKVYISLHSNGNRNGKPGASVCIYFGRNICTKARFIVGDYIEGLFNKATKTWLFRRTNDQAIGYKLGISGGNKNAGSSLMVVKITYNEVYFPKFKEGINELDSVTIDERGVFGTMK